MISGRMVGAVLSVAVLAVGCFPSRETLSANEVGCSADEVAISEAPVHEGVLEAGERWTAECHGRTYSCSQGHAEQQLLAHEANPLALVVTDQVTCQEVAESPQELENSRARQEARLRAAARQSQQAPQGAAGFEFGLSSEQSQQRCEAAGRAWSLASEGGRCSGTAADIGTSAQVGVGFCEGQACTITVEQRPADRWATRAVRLKAQLESKYGVAQSNSGRIPEDCRSDSSFGDCLQTRDLRLSYGWRWSSGETLSLEIGKAENETEPAIRLRYSRPKLAANLSHL